MTNPHNSPMSVSWLSYRFIIDVWSTSLPAIGAESLTGEVLYRQHCGACHGNDGEGTSEHFPRTLTGDKAIPRLAKFILKAMPPDEPGVLGAEDTERVAAYIHNAFYSREAQWRRRPPRVEATFLTGGQYGHAIADLMVSFYGTPATATEGVSRACLRSSSTALRQSRLLRRWPT